MTTDYEKTLRDLQEREQVIIQRLQELDRRNQVLKEVHEKLKARCFNQLLERISFDKTSSDTLSL
jgi:adenine C2-methylase RlmN of 23S rRNA A2503 and tRNA A37